MEIDTDPNSVSQKVGFLRDSPKVVLITRLRLLSCIPFEIPFETQYLSSIAKYFDKETETNHNTGEKKLKIAWSDIFFGLCDT